MSKDYIPANAGDFNSFQAFINTQATTNAAAWNLPAAEVTALNGFSTGFTPLYDAISNKNTRTRQQLYNYLAYRDGYVTFLRQFCQSFLTNNSLIPIGDRVAMKLNPRGLNPRSTRPKILTAPIPYITPVGGGMVDFVFKVANMDKKRGRHPDSNGIELFAKLEPLTTEPAPMNDVVEEGAEDGNDNNGDYRTSFSTLAQFRQELGLENVGKRLTIYARWVNTSDPEKNGPACNLVSIVVA